MWLCWKGTNRLQNKDILYVMQCDLVRVVIRLRSFVFLFMKYMLYKYTHPLDRMICRGEHSGLATVLRRHSQSC